MEGVQNPNKKMKVDVDKHQHDSEYDRRRVRTFRRTLIRILPFTNGIPGGQRHPCFMDNLSEDEMTEGCIEENLLIKSCYFRSKFLLLY
jgi:hypothetical protein